MLSRKTRSLQLLRSKNLRSKPWPVSSRLPRQRRLRARQDLRDRKDRRDHKDLRDHPDRQVAAVSDLRL